MLLLRSFFPLIVNRCAKIKSSDKHSQSRQISCHLLYKSKQTCEPRLVLQQFAAASLTMFATPWKPRCAPAQWRCDMR